MLRNTYGGQLSADRMHGFRVLHKADLPMRRQAGKRQVKKARDVGVFADGDGPIAGCLLGPLGTSKTANRAHFA